MTVSDAVSRGVLIDLDGTMVDSAEDIQCAVNLALSGRLIPELPLSLVKTFIGRGVTHLLQQVFAARNIHQTDVQEELRQSFLRCYAAVNGQYCTVFPDVIASLNNLQSAGYRLACVTNKPWELARDLLERMQLSAYFEVLVGAETAAGMKPSAAPLLYACQQLQLKPEMCVMVGDSEIDQRAAAAAGMAMYMVNYGYQMEAHEVSPHRQRVIRINSFAQLPDLLNQTQLESSLLL